MFSFDEKLVIILLFSELYWKDVFLGCVNFYYEESVYDKMVVVYYLYFNGNGFVYGGFLKGYEINDKGFVNICDYIEEEFCLIIEVFIEFLLIFFDIVREEVIVGNGNE